MSIRMKPLSSSGPEISVVTVGAGPLASSPGHYGYGVSLDDALETVRRTLDSGLTSIDTSNEYGAGESERRIGLVIAEQGLPDDFVLVTKADPPTRDGGVFDAARVRASWEESVARLGVDFVPVFHLHDPERYPFEELARPGGAIEGMRQLKEEGKIGLVGVAGSDLDDLRRHLDTGVYEVLLNHNRYTVLDQTASPLWDHALEAGAVVFNAAPYATGILAKPADAGARYFYGAPSDAIVDRVAALRSLCDEHGVPLAALALQFSTRDPRITTTVVGVSSPTRVDELVANEQVAIPRELWDAAAKLLELDLARHEL